MGIVNITVEVTNEDFVDTEIELEKKYGLKEVIIVDSVQSESVKSDQALKLQLGKAGAKYLQRTISNKDIIGVTWGSTLSAMVETMMPTPTKDVTVVQMLGGVGPSEAKEHAIDITRRLAQLLNGRSMLLQLPGVVESQEAKKILLADKRVSQTFETFQNINTAFVGIGALETNSVFQKENLEIPSNIKSEILGSNAVGDIGLNFFENDGKPIITGLDNLFIGMTLNELSNVKTVVDIAGGKEKYNAILGALEGKHINVLITDYDTAKRLLI